MQILDEKKRFFPENPEFPDRYANPGKDARGRQYDCRARDKGRGEG